MSFEPSMALELSPPPPLPVTLPKNATPRRQGAEYNEVSPFLWKREKLFLSFFFLHIPFDPCILKTHITQGLKERRFLWPTNNLKY